MNPNKLPPLPEPNISYKYSRMSSRDGTAHHDAFTADQMHAYAAEALRQSQSLPAGVVAGLVQRAEALIRRWRMRMPENATDSPRVLMREHCADELEQALQADAREKGEACSHHWHDYGHHAGKNLAFCARCEMVSAMGSEGVPYGSPKATQPAQASEKAVSDLVRKRLADLADAAIESDGDWFSSDKLAHETPRAIDSAAAEFIAYASPRLILAILRDSKDAK